MMDFKEIGGASGLNITSMLVQNAVAKNRELKELIDRPTQNAIEERPKDEKAGAKAKDASSQGDSPTLSNANQSTGRVVNVEA